MAVPIPPVDRLTHSLSLTSSLSVFWFLSCH